jgi:hypothetical protein
MCSNGINGVGRLVLAFPYGSCSVKSSSLSCFQYHGADGGSAKLPSRTHTILAATHNDSANSNNIVSIASVLYRLLGVLAEKTMPNYKVIANRADRPTKPIVLQPLTSAGKTACHRVAASDTLDD